MANILTHLQQLVTNPSITPHDAGCQDYIFSHLSRLGFRCQRFKQNKVDNLYAEIGNHGPRLVFAGHTDVVETGPLNNWQYPPFELTEINQNVYGRGVADMKGAVACMLTLAENWTKQTKITNGILGFLFTSGEEGDDYLDGTPFVMQKLKEQNIKIDFCVVGEPTSFKQTGDVIKVGRRGSLTGKATIKGRQGHVAYPHLAQNAIHMGLPFLTELSAYIWDTGNEHFDSSSLQITKILSSTSAANVIPGELEFQFNIRFNNLHTSEKIRQRISALATKHHLDLNWIWTTSGEPFLTSTGKLLTITQKCIEEICGDKPELSTSGGTSDARFIAPFDIEVIELGLPNQTIHQANECTTLKDLQLLEKLYFNITEKLLS